VKKESKKQKYKTLSKANLYIYAGQNNTMFTLTDLQGNTIGTKSPKAVGFKNCKKSTSHAVQIAANAMKDIILKSGNPLINIIFSGFGSGKEALMAFNDSEIKIISIDERFSHAFNGPKNKRERRL